MTYKLSSEAPESFCVQAKSGDISGAFQTAGTYKFSVLAVDQAGATAVVEQLFFTVLKQNVFAVGLRTTRVRTGSEYTDPAAPGIPLVVNESYRFSPLELRESDEAGKYNSIRKGTTVSAGSFDDITFTLEADDGWFVSAQTGEIFGQFDSVGKHDMVLYAVDAAGKQDVVEEMSFAVKKQPTFGLNPRYVSSRPLLLDTSYSAIVVFFSP